MLGQFAHARAKSRRQRSRIVLRCEGLEGRIQPDGGVSYPPPSTSHIDSNQAPVIVDFNCQQIGSGTFLVTGRVIDENPSGLIVTLGGDTSAAGTTITTAADGTFTKTIILRIDGTDRGYITAATIDAFGLISNEVSQFVNPT